MVGKITLSTLGINGRFGNQIFQYAFLKIYAKKYNLDVEVPSWIGQELFGHADHPISDKLPEVREEQYNFLDTLSQNTMDFIKDVDIWGYFLYNTKHYLPYKTYFQSLFKPLPEIQQEIAGHFTEINQSGRKIIGLHLRRGDFGYGDYYIAPTSWYKNWLKSIWCASDNPILFIASDELDKVIFDFKEYNPITTHNYKFSLPGASYYPDFFMLSHCDILATSNSTFSFAASLLNENCHSFLRPHYRSRKLVSYDPWNSEPLLTGAKDDAFFQVSQKLEKVLLRIIKINKKLKMRTG